jgi:hypothetical protein
LENLKIPAEKPKGKNKMSVTKQSAIERERTQGLLRQQQKKIEARDKRTLEIMLPQHHNVAPPTRQSQIRPRQETLMNPQTLGQ